MITLEIRDAVKRDWILASRAMNKVADQLERDFATPCKVKCPLEMALQDFWGSRQYDFTEVLPSEEISVSVQDAKLADLKHHLAFGFHRVFRKTLTPDNSLPSWNIQKYPDYFYAKGRQQLKARFQWKENYVAWIPPLQRLRSTAGQWPSIAFYKKFLEMLLTKNYLPVQTLDLQGATYLGSWEKPLVASSEFRGCFPRACPDLYALADWMLNASCIVAEESWMTDFAACLRVPSFVFYDRDPSNIFYHFGYSEFALRYFACNSMTHLLDHHHAHEEFSTFLSQLLCFS